MALPLKQCYSLSLYFGNPVGVEPVLRNLLYAAKREAMEVIIVRRRSGSLFEGEEDRADGGLTVRYLESDAPSSLRLQDRIVQEIGERKVFRNAYCEAHGLQPTDPDALKEAFRYIQQHTRPLLILFERFLDFCKNADDACLGLLPTVFQQGAGYHYYFAACFYPDDGVKLSAESLMTAYNPEKMLLLFGGQFHRQGLDTLPGAYGQIRQVSESYNTCLMKYKGEYHQLRMPCGPLQRTEHDADDDGIF